MNQRLADLTQYLDSYELEHGQKTYFLVPHSHNDLGWQKSIDEYQSQAIDFILNSSVDALKTDSSRKFTYCNIGFLYNWLQRFPERLSSVKDLLKSGQLYIVNGGIAVHDNACTHVDDIISNYEFGRMFCRQHLGVNPKLGWLIDPFGHSKTTTRVFSQMHYQAYVLNRIPTLEKMKLRRAKEMVFKWRKLG